MDDVNVSLDTEKAKDALETSYSTLQDIKSSRKALKDVIGRIAGTTECDKTEVRLASKLLYMKGQGWDGSPVMLAKGAKKKDPLSAALNKLIVLITSLQDTGHSEHLKEYLDAMAQNGITITLDESRNKEIDEDSYQDYVDAKAYLKAIEEYQDEIKEEDAEAAADSGLIPSTSKYKGVLDIYTKARNGKEVDDKIHQGAYEALVMQQAYSYLDANKANFADTN